MKTISQARIGPVFSLGFEFGMHLAAGALALAIAFALMLRSDTAPAIAFAYLLFFTTLRSVTTLVLTRERAIQFAVASILCMAASFWALRCHSPMTWDRQDAGPFSIAWRSAIILLCVLAVPRFASYLASRYLKRFRPPAAHAPDDAAID